MKNFTEKEIEYIINSYKNGVSKNKLRLEFGVSEGVIKRILKQNGIQIRQVQETNKRKFNINDNYFDVENPNMAYILGLWAADGNVHSTENRMDLELNSADLEILEQIKAELQSERPIKIYQCQNGYTKNKLFFWSSHIKQKFAEYGIVPNKTYSKLFHAPYKLDKKYWIDYIRGFFDGDGCVKKASSLTFELNSINKQFLIDIQSFMKEYYNIDMQLSIGHDRPGQYTLYRLYCYGEYAKKVYNILYTPNSLFLKRKYERWQELL